MKTKIMELQEALIAWRRIERQHSVAVLCANHPATIQSLKEISERALDDVRKIIDSEPWAEIARGD